MNEKKFDIYMKKTNFALSITQLDQEQLHWTPGMGAEFSGQAGRGSAAVDLDKFWILDTLHFDTF